MKKNSGILDSGILDLLESGNGRKNGPQSSMFKWRCSLNISPQVAACIFFFFFFSVTPPSLNIYLNHVYSLFLD